MRRLSIMSALAVAALADAPSVRAQVVARQRHEENLLRCRVLAQILRMPADEVQRQAAELDWGMHALQRKLEGPPKRFTETEFQALPRAPGQTGTLRIQGVEIPVDPQRDTAVDISIRAAQLGIRLEVSGEDLILRSGRPASVGELQQARALWHHNLPRA